MSNFSSKTKYVEARPRREKKLGRGGSVVSVAANGGGSGVSKSYVDSNFVTIATEQTISGAKDFVGGIKVNGMPIIYNTELGVWEFTGDLFVTGNFAWGSSIDGFKPSTVTDAVRVDGSTIIKKKDSNGDWYLYAPGGSGGGSGGGLTLGDVVSYLSDNDYTTKTDVNSLIVSSLAGYATEQWVANKGYLTSSALNGLASQSWVSDNYLSKSGGTIEGVLELSSTNAARSIRFATSVGSSWLFVNSGEWYVTNIGWGAEYKLIHSGNIGLYNAGSATKLATPRTIWGQSFDGTGNVDGQLDINGLGTLHRDDSALWLNYGGANSNQSLRVCGYDIAFYYGIGSNFTRAITITNGGNVAVGGTTADAKLHIYGDAKVTSALTVATNVQIPVNGDRITFCSASGTYTKGILAMNTNNTYLEAPLSSDSKTASKPPIMIGWRDGTYPIYINANTNVAIGGTTAEAKLHVHGNSRYEGYLHTKDSFVNTLARYYSGQWARGVEWLGIGDTINASIQAYGNNSIIEYINITANGDFSNLGIRIYNSGLITLGGDTTINGNLLVNGNVSWFSHSQRSLKNIVSEQGLSLAQLERIKPIKFYWKDGRDMALHVGGVADVFAEVLPEVVTRNLQAILCLNYVDAAFYVGASLIAPVLDHERRITKGEAEQEAQKKETAKLKRELEEVKGKLNQLVA